jgi:glycosyltransferase 2 family protein
VPAGRRADMTQSRVSDVAASPGEAPIVLTAERATVTRWRRHPADVARLLCALAVLLVLLAIAWLQPDAVRNVSRELVGLFRRLPDGAAAVLVGIVQLAALAAPVVAVAALVRTGRWRLLGLTAIASGVAAGVMALLQGWLDDRIPPLSPDEVAAWVGGREYPSGAYLAAMAAGLVVLSSSWRPPVRRLAIALLGLAMFARVVTTAATVLNVSVMAAIGVVVGSAALVAFGGPVRQLGLDGLHAALATAGLPVTDLVELAHEPGHRRTFAARDRDGEAVQLKLVDADERDAQLLYQVVRSLRVTSLEDERPGWDPRRVVEHEGLTSLLAQQAGVDVPAVLAVTVAEAGEGVIASRPPDGEPLSDLDPTAMGDPVLDDAFSQLTALHAAGIAHRAVSAGSLLVRDGRVTVVDLRRANRNAEPSLLAADVAQLLASVAVLVGIERTVAAAARVVPRERLAASLAYLQPVILPGDVTTALPERRARKAFLARLSSEVQETTGAEAVKLAPIARLTPGNVLSLAGGVFLLFVVVAFASQWELISDALGEADWSEWPSLLFWTVIVMVSGAFSLIGAVARPLPLLPTMEVMLGQSFLNRFTPANAGGMAMRVRYLQVRGIDPISGAASVGLTSLASGIVQAALLVTFGVWAGSTNALSFELPDVNVVALVVVVLLVVAGFLWLTSWGRRLRGMAVPRLAQVWVELKPLAAQPGKALWLFGGALMGKLGNILAFTAACRALGIDLAFEHLALLYMTGNTVASAAPTPGGVGAVEAALTAALTGAGVDSGVALAAVLVFRLFTYWLPVPFSYLALRDCRRRELV